MMGHEHHEQPPKLGEDKIRVRAAEWHAASAHDDMDWVGFTDWLNADPCHRSAYEEIALVDAVLEDHRDQLRELDYVTPSVEQRRTTSRLGWGGWAAIAIAASIAGAFTLPRILAVPTATYRTQAAAAKIALEDGSAIVLAPHSELTVSGTQQETIRLSGEAWFDIRHQPTRKLAIEADGFAISDIGTRFDVQSDRMQVRVAVADGVLTVGSDTLNQPVRLTQGREFLFDGKAGTVTIRDIKRETIGLWRTGRLSYVDAPLSLVVADICRYAGIRVEVAPALRDRVFSGTFVIGNGEGALRDLSQLMGLEFVSSRSGYSLVEHHR